MLNGSNGLSTCGIPFKKSACLNVVFCTMPCYIFSPKKCFKHFSVFLDYANINMLAVCELPLQLGVHKLHSNGHTSNVNLNGQMVFPAEICIPWNILMHQNGIL